MVGVVDAEALNVRLYPEIERLKKVVDCRGRLVTDSTCKGCHLGARPYRVDLTFPGLVSKYTIRLWARFSIFDGDAPDRYHSIQVYIGKANWDQ